MEKICPYCHSLLKCGCHICHAKNSNDDHLVNVGNGIKSCSVCGFTAYDSEWTAPETALYIPSQENNSCPGC
jgi:hypothetical protein